MEALKGAYHFGGIIVASTSTEGAFDMYEELGQK